VAENGEIHVLELVDVQAALPDAVLAQLVQQVGVAAVQREPVQRQGRFARAEPDPSHLPGVAGGVGVAQVPETHDGRPPHPGLGPGLFAEDVEQFQPLGAAARRLHLMQELEHRIVGRPRLHVVHHAGSLRRRDSAPSRGLAAGRRPAPRGASFRTSDRRARLALLPHAVRECGALGRGIGAPEGGD